VFAAGLSMRRIEHRFSGGRKPREVMGQVDTGDMEAALTDPKRAHAFMAESVLGFTGEIERIAELSVMLIVGSFLSMSLLTWQSAALIGVLFLVIRPLSVELALLGSGTAPAQRRLMSWFGIRGVGSFYYLLYAIEHTPRGSAVRFAPWVTAVIAASVVVHGISGTPLMNRYQRARPGS
jgi:NhaP-type Na+/H+ or K+/H+ antiporter